MILPPIPTKENASETNLEGIRVEIFNEWVVYFLPTAGKYLKGKKLSEITFTELDALFPDNNFDPWLHNLYGPALKNRSGVNYYYYLNGESKIRKVWEVERIKLIHDVEFNKKMDRLLK